MVDEYVLTCEVPRVRCAHENRTDLHEAFTRLVIASCLLQLITTKAYRVP